MYNQSKNAFNKYIDESYISLLMKFLLDAATLGRNQLNGDWSLCNFSSVASQLQQN